MRNYFAEVNYIKIKKTCRHCGVDYFVAKSQESRTKFCSDKCFRASRNTQTLYKCDYCGEEFLTRKSKIDDVKSGKRKYLCCSRECANNIQKPIWEDVVRAFELFEYDLISTEYISNKSKLKYICRHHRDKGVQEVTYNNIKSGFGCKYCGMERTADARRLTIDDVRRIFDRNDMILVEGQEYTNTTQKMAYICKHHKEFGVQYMAVSNAYKNHCPHCKLSKGEIAVANYLTSNNISFESQKKFDGLLGVGGRSLSYDFYLPDNNMLIEFQGEYHDGTVSNQSEEQFAVQTEHDRRKKAYANAHSIDLLEVWYYDRKNINNILSSALHIQ